MIIISLSRLYLHANILYGEMASILTVSFIFPTHVVSASYISIIKNVFTGIHMIMPTLDIVDFLTKKSPLNTFIIGLAGVGKIFLSRKLIPNLVGKECIELYVDRDYNYFEYEDLTTLFKNPAS